MQACPLKNYWPVTAMAVLLLNRNRSGGVSGYILVTSYSERQGAKAVGGRWDADLKAWKLSLGTDVEELRQHLALSVDEEAGEYLRQQEEARRHLVNLHLVDDAVIRYPQGLDPYQRVGVRWLADVKRGLLADGMGMGKTIQTIRACDEVGAERVLVVTKKSLIGQWKSEIERFAANCMCECVVLNYEQAVKKLDELIGCEFDVLVVDEAPRIKNRKARRTKAVHKLAKKIPYLFLLTGTPIHNRPDELWSLLHAIDPIKYSSYWKFVERYCMVEETWQGYTRIAGAKNLPTLHKELAPIMLRRDKALLNLSSKTHETVLLELEGEQAKLYQQMRKTMIAVLDQERSLVATTVLAQLTRLRQITCDTSLVGGKGKSVKTEWLLEYMEDYAQDHKLLVFSNFAQYVIKLSKSLADYGALAYHGQMPANKRDEAVCKFQEDPTCRVLVGTIGAMGEGLNLAAADVVVFMDKDWVPAINEQAEDRAYRRGQERPVHVITLTAKGTVDEYLEEVLADKSRVASEIVAIERVLEMERRAG